MFSGEWREEKEGLELRSFPQNVACLVFIAEPQFSTKNVSAIRRKHLIEPQNTRCENFGSHNSCVIATQRRGNYFGQIDCKLVVVMLMG
jgi:hypothetical protein